MMFGRCLCVAVFVFGYFMNATAGAEQPTPLIFETDIGNDIDDALALRRHPRLGEPGRVQVAGGHDQQRQSALRAVR